MEFSKRILVANWVATLALTGLVAAFSIAQVDCTELGAIAALAWAELASSNIFYYWKAKNENRIKLTKTMVKEWADEYGIESVTALAEIVLRE